jgi:adenosylmethionine-8-amino-7-oxononanoate aminotransferase
LQSFKVSSKCEAAGLIGAVDLAGESGNTAAKVLSRRPRARVLTRHIRNTVVLMPPLIISIAQIEQIAKTF